MAQNEPAFLLNKARHCREIAKGISDQRTREILVHMADDYEARADRLQDERTGLISRS
jgi:hypothetical protein